MILTKGAVVTFKKGCKLGSNKYLAGDVYSVWIPSPTIDAGNALIVKHGKRGARLSCLDQKNVKPLHHNEVAQLVELGFAEVN